MKSRQLSFQSNRAFSDHRPRIELGGDLRKGRRKLQRPFDSKKALHITLRSSKARGRWSLANGKNEKKVTKAVFTYAARFNVKIFRFANAGNHLHILMKANTRVDFQNFLRTLSGVVARLVTKAKKGNSGGKFWDSLAYSKLIHFGRHFKNTSNYVLRNTLEAFGIIPPRTQARGHVKLDFETLFDDF